MAELIYNQTQIPKDRWRYAFRASASTGCGWIAAYNALCIMGYDPEPEVIIRDFRRSVPIINGNFGTFLFTPVRYFRRHGFEVRICLKRASFDKAAKNADACLMFYGWRRRWKAGLHYVALHHDAERFLGYNTFRNSEGPDVYGESLEGFIKKRKYFFVVLITLRRKTNRTEHVK